MKISIQYGIEHTNYADFYLTFWSALVPFGVNEKSRRCNDWTSKRTDGSGYRET